MTETDQLTGVELRRRVAEAAGWNWETHGGGIGAAWNPALRLVYMHSWLPITWEHAMAAADAAGLRRGHVWNVYENCIHIRNLSEKKLAVMVDGFGPEELCRAIVKFVELRKALEASPHHPDEHPGYKWRPDDPAWPNDD